MNTLIAFLVNAVFTLIGLFVVAVTIFLIVPSIIIMILQMMAFKKV